MQGLKRILAATGAIAALCTATSAFAVMSAPYGWYLEGNLGTSYQSNHTYPIPHSVCAEEVKDISDWIQRIAAA